MEKQERAKKVKEMLDGYYPVVKPALDFKDHYTLLISVLLSAQCTDKRVNETTPQLFGLADNPYEMVKVKVKEIEDIIRPCGLAPRKSKAIYDLSQILIDKHQGKVPDNFPDLEELPGVGHKTASVVMSQGFGVPAFPVDTHIHRLSKRWGLSIGKNVETTERDLKKLFDEKDWNKLHLQIIYYGREYCSARACYGLICPICRTIFPRRKTKIENP